MWREDIIYNSRNYFWHIAAFLYSVTFFRSTIVEIIFGIQPVLCKNLSYPIYNSRNYFWHIARLSILVHRIIYNSRNYFWHIALFGSHGFRWYLQQQKLFLAYSPFPGVLLQVSSTIVEIIFGIQPLSINYYCATNLQQQKLFLAYSPEKIEDEEVAIYNSRNYFWHIAYSIFEIVRRISTIVEIIFGIQPLSAVNQVLDLQQQKLFLAYSPTIKIILNYESTIVEIIFGIQPPNRRG